MARKVAEVRARVARVRELLPPTVEDLEVQRTEAEALILNLFLGLQACGDLAMHVVAERGLGVPADTRSAFTLLANAGTVPPDLSRRLSAAIGLRNRIAHQYESLDMCLLHEAATDGLEDLLRFAGAIAEACGL